MDTAMPDLGSRLVAALAEDPPRIPVVLGPCGSGRTSLLGRIGGRLGRGAAQYVDLERITSTPERFFAAITSETPFRWRPPDAPPDGPPGAYAHTLSYFRDARLKSGGPATLLLDEFLEFRTFESFPGLRSAMADTIAALAASPNRFVLATKFAMRALRLLEQASDRFLVVQTPPMPVSAVAADLLGMPGVRSDEAEDLGRVIVSLADGRAAYCGAFVRALGAPGLRVHDPVAALTALVSPGGELFTRCRYSYEIRLHRARGYGALKGILGILADDEPLNLTEIALRLGRTPGSTKDYLGWLEDVDLIRAQRKRYTFADPVLRLWVRLHAGCEAWSAERVADAVQRYALLRLSAGAPTSELSRD